ncbi:BMC domain-containing protein [Caproiciproducens sp. CPB-2]|uniref:BMC domain-containing protein n=1 Tax=Caproiciproducens sp. CPB-2 TaxID=3030017 RepID=UPI0023DB4DF0|nr:BMC domain-containing protein [Caproiciproducens sp. CPB-2]MDF1494898.1 BMC domain-containing protein [Caproiciproducens sp. CPB-2]
MSKAIGMIEFSSIARGIETSDYMIKAANVDLLKASTVCPGKYIVLIGGTTGDVKVSMAVGEKYAGEYLVDTLLIPNIHSQLIPAICLTNQVENPGAVGVLEFYSVASAVTAGDVAAKAANVTLIEIKIGYSIGGKGVVVLTGDVGAVRTAVEAAKKQCELLVQTTVIPKPSPKLYETLL